MARYITLSKAARLVGVKRGTLQKKIRAGELSTFEGELDVTELLRVYPDTQMEDNSMLERVEQFMEQAFAKAMRAESQALDVHTLARRVSLLSRELAVSESEINRYSSLIELIKQQVATLKEKEDINRFKSWFVHALEGTDEIHALPDNMLAKEAFLRIMAAHVRIMPSGHDFFVEGSRDLLDSGLSDGLSLTYGCSDGSCGRCRGRLVAGEIRQIRAPRFTLSDDQRGRGEFLLCCHTAVSDIVIEHKEWQHATEIGAQQLETTVSKINGADPQVSVLQLRVPSHQRLEFLSGQYARLETANGFSGEFSLASCPCDANKLEFHLQTTNADEEVTQRLGIQAGGAVSITGHYGEFVLGSDSSRPLVMIAVDAGFAPVKGLIEQAIALDLVESIDLYWLSSEKSARYLDNLCRSWSDALDIFNYHPVAQAADMEQMLAALREQLQQDDIDVSASSIYLCATEPWQGALCQLLKEHGVQQEQLHLEPLRQGAALAVAT